jgi:glycosyltransferase involved in cell wall biosynthesis
MRIAIGMLAWNEESSIAATIGSLARQSLLARADGAAFRIEVVIVPNGCTDRTPEVAAEALRGLVARFPRVEARVESLAEGGKSNAWNEFIHHLAPQDADYHILMDADIELLTPETLERMWEALERDPHALIATDQPVKHLVRKARLNLLEKLLLGAGAMTRATPGQLTGQLYCARGAMLRRIWMPRGIIVEDGFLKQIVCTDGFSIPVDNSRIVRADGASHLFECYTKPRDIWNHQVRQAIGHTLYTYLTKYLRTEMTQRPVFEPLLEQCRRDPEWFLRRIREEVASRGWWVMDTASLGMRWRRVRHAKGAAKLKFLLIAAAATPYDLAVFLASNSRLRSGRVKGVWKDTRTVTLS